MIAMLFTDILLAVDATQRKPVAIGSVVALPVIRLVRMVAFVSQFSHTDSITALPTVRLSFGTERSTMRTKATPRAGPVERCLRLSVRSASLRVGLAAMLGALFQLRHLLRDGARSIARLIGRPQW